MTDPELPMEPASDGEGPFIERALRALDGLLDADALAALKAEMAGDVDKRRLFVHLCLQARAIAELMSVRRQGDESDDRALLDALGPRLVAGPETDEPEPVLAPRVRRDDRSVPPRRPWIRWVIATAVFLVGAGATVLFWPRGRRDEAPVASRPHSPEAPVAPWLPPPIAPASARDGLAIVIQLDAALWEMADAPVHEVGSILTERRLQLRSGRVTLALLSGVMLTLEGPADLELISADQVLCHRGKVQIRVPQRVQGFVLSTPNSNVTDLGTEFGLNVGADGKTRVMVFKGRVEASVIGATGSALRSREVPEHRALELDSLGLQIRDIEARPEDFARPPELAIPPLALAPSYRETVLAARPWGYWRFAAIDGGAVPNEIAERPPLRVTGPVHLAGSGNRSIAFGDDEPERYLMMDGSWSPPRMPGHAIELWFAPERIAVAALATLSVPRGGTNYEDYLYVELTARGPLWELIQRPAIRYLHRWPPGWQGGDNLVSNYYVPYRWHHVVAQIVGDQMELYLNGTPLPPLSVSSDRNTAACRFIVGAFKPRPRNPHPWEVRPFVGQIDELALYDHPLSAEEIRGHSALGRTGGGQPRP